MRAILVIGECGSGKTWVMKQLIRSLGQQGGSRRYKLSLMHWVETGSEGRVAVLGQYKGGVFDGSDNLSMAVSKSFAGFRRYAKKKYNVLVAEGDRFTNKRFIELFSPIIVRIEDDGERGRNKRGSRQAERHLKAIKTRVEGYTPDYSCKDSTEALKRVKEIISNG